MRWQTPARVVVAAIGLSCAVALYVLLRDRPEPPPPAPPPTDPAAVSQQTKARVLRFKGNKGVGELIADDVLTYADGRRVFRQVEFTTERAGVKYVVKGDEAETAGVAGLGNEFPSELKFTRNLSVTGEDGLQLDGGPATYLQNEEILKIPGPASFTRGRMTGRGVGLDLHLEKSVLWLLDQAELTLAADQPGGTAIVATAKSIGLADAERYMRLTERAVITRDGQRLAGDSALIYLAAGTDAAKSIELRGSSSVSRPGGGTGGPPGMRADDINLEFSDQTQKLAHARLAGSAVMTVTDPEGQTRISGSTVDLYVGADGQTLTRLDAVAPVEVRLPRTATSPARTIKSSGLAAVGEEGRGLTRAVFSDSVDYRETRPAGGGQPAAVRVATAQSLVLELNGDLGDVKSAEFRQNFEIKDGELTAGADVGTYDAAKESLQLRGATPVKRRPFVTDAEVSIDAPQIDVVIATHAMTATGGTNSVRRPTPAGRGTAPAKKVNTGLFEEGKAITGRSDTLTYTKESGRAVYEGNVLLVQDLSEIRGDRVSIDEQLGNLSASGKVQTTFEIANAPGSSAAKGKTGRTTITAQEMAYTDADRTAVYTGTAQMRSSSSERIRAGRIALVFNETDRSLKSADATALAGEVRVDLPEGGQAAGQHLTYDAAADQYKVTGQPAMYLTRAPARGPDACDQSAGTELTLLRTAGRSTIGTTLGAQGRAVPVKCSEVIK